jgi:hypothetical protein
MAKSFYGYVKRDDKAFVDWGAIGSQLSDDLAKESKRRQDERQEIELQTIEDVNEINKLAANQDKLNGEFYMDAADQIRDFLLMQQTEMQKGGWNGLRPSEFLKQRQVVNDGVDQLAEAAKAQAEQQDELLKRVQNNEAGASEEFNTEMFNKFYRAQNQGLYVNPVNGRMYISKRDPETGKISNNPEDLLDVNNLSQIMGYRANRPDIDQAVIDAGKTLKPTTIALTQGGIKSIKSAMLNKDYEKAEKNIIDGILVSDITTGDILAQAGYSYTSDPKVAKDDPKKILMKKDGTSIFNPELTEEQKTDAEEILRSRIRASIEKVQTGREESSADRQYNRGLALKKNKRIGYINELEKIYSGGQVDVESALGSILGRLGEDAPRVKVKQDEILLTYPDGSTDRIPKDGTFEDFTIAAGTKLLPSDVDDITVAYDDWVASGAKANPKSFIETRTLGRKGAGVPLASIEIEVGDETKTPKEYIDDTDKKEMDEAVEKVLVDSLPEEYKNKLKVSINKTKFFGFATGGILQISLPGVIENLKFKVPSDKGEVYKLVELIKSAAEDGRQISIEEIAKVYKDPKDQSNLREINEVKLKKTPISQ